MALNVLGGNTPSIVNPIPWGLIPQVGQFSSQYQPGDIAYDFAIAGIPFLSGESLRGTYFRRMYTREFAPIRKDQFDNQQVPGEQSILGWWLRSQSNFTQGTGAQYLDTTVDQSLAQRYYYSEHIDVFNTPGNLQLTQATKQILSSTNVNLILRSVYFGGDAVLVADGLVIKRINAAGTVTTYAMPAGLTGQIESMTDDGVNYYFVDQSQGIFKGVISTPNTPATKIWNIPSSSGNFVLEWVKGRLVAGLDNSVYELTGTGPTLPTPKFTHFNSSYHFVSITGVPSAIMVAGVSGSLSEIHKFTLDAGGALPTLTSGVVTAAMPYGEAINCIYGYLGTFVAIGTTKGLRIATTDTNGNLSYGPLVFQMVTPSGTLPGVIAVGGYDRFIVAGNTNNLATPTPAFTNPSAASATSMLIKVDLSQNTSDGGYPWANDLDSHTNSWVCSIANFGTSVTASGMLAFSVAGRGVYITDTANKESTGVLYTSRIRYNTLEDKHFKFLFLRNQPITDGSIYVNAIDPSGGNTSVLAQGVGTTVGSSDPTLIGTEGNQKEWLQLLFTLNRGVSNTNVSPILNGYQLRGLPGVDRQLLITIPLSCHDFESDKFGNPVGYDGYAYARLAALEALISSGNLVLLQDLNYGTANLVIVDNYRFEQQSNEQPKTSSQGRSDSNARGGYIILEARVVQ